MSVVRRLDHVAVVVRDTEEALQASRDRFGLGLGVAASLAPPNAPAPIGGSGRGRVSAFVPGDPTHGVRLECTEFRRLEDVEGSRGWLPEE